MTDNPSPGQQFGEFLKRFESDHLDDVNEVLPDGSAFHIFRQDGVVRYTITDTAGQVASEGSVYEKGSARPDDYPAHWPFFTTAKCSLVKLPDGKRMAWWGNDDADGPLLDRFVAAFRELGWSVTENEEPTPMLKMVKLNRESEDVTIMAMAFPTTMMVQIISG